MAHLDAEAETAAVRVALGSVQDGVTFAVSAQVNTLRQRPCVLNFAAEGVRVRTNRVGRIALNARVSVERGKGNAITAALQPTEAEAVFHKRHVGGAQQDSVG